MAIEGDLQSILGAVVGGRCYPIINRSLTVIYPYITFMVIGKTPENHLEGGSGLTLCRVQIDAWAKEYGTAKNTGESIKTAIAGSLLNGVQVFGFDQFEDEADVFRVCLEYEFWSEE